jgi:uncharacterized protein (TIGR02117 family)
MRRFFKGLGAIIALGLVALIAGTLVPWPLAQQELAGGQTTEILVITNPIHTDIAIPATPEALKTFGFLKDSGLPLDAPGVRWIIFGWGGRAFYLETPNWSEVKLVPVLKALTLDRSVMHVELAGEIDRTLPQVKSIAVSANASGKDIPAIERVYSLIAGSFEGKAPTAIPNAGYGPNDRFFESKGGFNIFIGCNVWAAKVLRAAGLKTGIWNPLPQSLVYSLNLHNSI